MAQRQQPDGSSSVRRRVVALVALGVTGVAVVFTVGPTFVRAASNGVSHLFGRDRATVEVQNDLYTAEKTVSSRPTPLNPFKDTFSRFRPDPTRQADVFVVGRPPEVDPAQGGEMLISFHRLFQGENADAGLEEVAVSSMESKRKCGI